MTLTVRLPETIESQLTRFCEAMGMSKSQVVQGALKDWFAKPVVAEHHPLLAFAEASANAVPSAQWAGPYSKDRLRERVLASGAAQRVSEPVADYPTVQHKPSARQKAVKSAAKSGATQATLQSKTHLA